MAWRLGRARDQLDHARWVAGDQAHLDGPAAVALQADQVAVDGRRPQAEHGLQIGAIGRDRWRADRRWREGARVVLPVAPGVLAPGGEVAQVTGVVAPGGG